MFGSLHSVSPRQILTNTDSIIAQDRKLTLRLLEHLHEIDRRKLYLECGFGSLFDYCTKHLKLAEPSAARRIRTARCVARYPQLYSLLESGALNLTVVSMMSKHIKPGNVDEVINRIKGKSKREVERLIAEYEPRAALTADRMRRMVVPIARTSIAHVASTGSPVPTVRPNVAIPSATVHVIAPDPSMPVVAASRSAVSTDSIARATAPGAVIATPTTSQAGSNFTVTGDSEKSPNPPAVRCSGERTDSIANAPEAGTSESRPVQFERLVRVEFTANEKLMSKLERVRSLASHRLPGNATLEELIDFMAEYVITREDPSRRHERRELRGVKQDKKKTQTVSDNARHIPAQVRDEVFVRDNQCTYVSPGGQRCDSTHVLQIDHIKPVARGGASTIDNLRVLCAYHNRLESERLMGKHCLAKGAD